MSLREKLSKRRNATACGCESTQQNSGARAWEKERDALRKNMGATCRAFPDIPNRTEPVGEDSTWTQYFSTRTRDNINLITIAMHSRNLCTVSDHYIVDASEPLSATRLLALGLAPFLAPQHVLFDLKLQRPLSWLECLFTKLSEDIGRTLHDQLAVG